ncbi:ILVBL protein, partial [Psophia crepitans]|nr:ILVBL protein [Psophia crepitans]
VGNGFSWPNGWKVLGCPGCAKKGSKTLWVSRVLPWVQGDPLPPPPHHCSTGRIGVAAVTAGPGVTNTVTAVKNAQMAESPVLLIGGAAASLQKGRGALQDIDQLSLFKTLCKACVSVRTVRDIVPTLRKAIVTAQSGTPGPVFVELPIDVLYPFHVVEKEIGGTKSARGLRGKAVQWYLQNYIRNLFAGAWEPRDMSPLPVQMPLATEDEVGFGVTPVPPNRGLGVLG